MTDLTDRSVTSTVYQTEYTATKNFLGASRRVRNFRVPISYPVQSSTCALGRNGDAVVLAFRNCLFLRKCYSYTSFSITAVEFLVSLGKRQVSRGTFLSCGEAGAAV